MNHVEDIMCLYGVPNIPLLDETQRAAYTSPGGVAGRKCRTTEGGLRHSQYAKRMDNMHSSGPGGSQCAVYGHSRDWERSYAACCCDLR